MLLSMHVTSVIFVQFDNFALTMLLLLELHALTQVVHSYVLLHWYILSLNSMLICSFLTLCSSRSLLHVSSLTYLVKE